MRRILLHPLASVLSALGIGVADRLAVRRASLRHSLDEAGLAAARAQLEELSSQAEAELAAHGGDGRALRRAQFLELRAGDSEVSLSVPCGSLEAVRSQFAAEHLRRFGFASGAASVLIEALRAEVRVASVAGQLSLPSVPLEPQLPARVRAWFGAWREVPLRPAATLTTPLAGPALLVDPHTTLVLDEGWRAVPLAPGVLLIEDEGAARAAAISTADPARIEIFNNLFMHVAEQMGEVLKATAQSVNIRERLDYSCALFDPHGGLVANAPHMPVHLGSMGASVRAVMRAQPQLRPGDSGSSTAPTTAARTCRT